MGKIHKKGGGVIVGVGVNRFITSSKFLCRHKMRQSTRDKCERAQTHTKISGMNNLNLSVRIPDMSLQSAVFPMKPFLLLATIEQQECFFSVWQQASQVVMKRRGSSGPSDAALARSVEVRTSSSHRDASGSVRLTEAAQRHRTARLQNLSRDCFKYAFTSAWWKYQGQAGTVFLFWFFAGRKKSNTRRRKKKKKIRCLQAEARQSGSWMWSSVC